MDAALSQIIATVLQLGFPGVVILWLVWWNNKLQLRIDGLTDKLMTTTEQATKASGEMAAAMNRLTDTLIRGKPE